MSINGVRYFYIFGIMILCGCNSPDLADLSASDPESLLPAQPEVDIGPLLARERSIVEHFPKSSNKLAFDLYRELSAEDENLVFSPFSVSSALAMAYAG